jgi:hypothetical protein
MALTKRLSLAFAVISDAANQVDDEHDDENGAEYSTADVHVILRLFRGDFIGTRRKAARLRAGVHSDGSRRPEHAPDEPDLALLEAAPRVAGLLGKIVDEHAEAELSLSILDVSGTQHLNGHSAPS